MHPARSWTADSTRDDRGVLRHRHSLGSPLGRGQQTGEARGGGQWQWHRRNLSSALHPINPGLSPTRRGPAQLAREGGFQEGEGPASPGLAGGAAASPQAPWRVRPSFAGKLRWPRSRGRTDAPRNRGGRTSRTGVSRTDGWAVSLEGLNRFAGGRMSRCGLLGLSDPADFPLNSCEVAPQTGTRIQEVGLRQGREGIPSFPEPPSWVWNSRNREML